MNQTALQSATLRVQAEHVADQYLPNGGRPPMTSDANTVQLLLAALMDGNYRETACHLAGIAKGTFYNTLKRADAGDEAAQAFRDAVEKAEALAENEMVVAVRKAGKSPQFWAAAATHLERRHPDRWGKRQDDSQIPRVVVQVGGQSSDVKVLIAGSVPAEIQGNHNHAYQTQTESECEQTQVLAAPQISATQAKGRGRKPTRTQRRLANQKAPGSA